MLQCPESHSSASDVAFRGCVTASGDHQAEGRLATWMSLHDAKATWESATPEITQGKERKTTTTIKINKNKKKKTQGIPNQHGCFELYLKKIIQFNVLTSHFYNSSTFEAEAEGAP